MCSNTLDAPCRSQAVYGIDIIVTGGLNVSADAMVVIGANEFNAN
jgi:hypothetical protein